MSKGREIVLTAEPQGRFLEGIILGTPKPGTCMEQTSAAPVNGRFTYQAVTRATGAKGPVFVLLPDTYQGKLGVGDATAFGPGAAGDAYVNNTRGFLYAPEAGEELNMLVADVAGTADDVLVGALFAIQTTTGKLVANSSNTSAPFQSNEAVTDPTADYLLWCTYLGNQA